MRQKGISMDVKILEKKLNEKLKGKKDHYSKEDYVVHNELFHKKHTAHNSYEDMIICAEEMSELTQNISKVIRGKRNPNDTEFLEEIADVQFCLKQLIQCYSLDKEKIKYIKDIKHERFLQNVNDKKL